MVGGFAQWSADYQVGRLSMSGRCVPTSDRMDMYHRADLGVARSEFLRTFGGFVAPPFSISARILGMRATAVPATWSDHFDTLFWPHLPIFP